MKFHKGQFFLFANILFPINLVIYLSYVFKYKDAPILEYTDPVPATCSSGFYRKDGFCYPAPATEKLQCERDMIDSCRSKILPLSCPTNKYLKQDGKDFNCYTVYLFVEPTNPSCPENFIRNWNTCIPEDESVEDDRQESLMCSSEKALRNLKCYTVMELTDESCPENLLLLESGACANDSATGKVTELKCDDDKVLISDKCYTTRVIDNPAVILSS